MIYLSPAPLDHGKGVVTLRDFCQCAVVTLRSSTGSAVNGSPAVVKSAAHLNLMVATHGMGSERGAVADYNRSDKKLCTPPPSSREQGPLGASIRDMTDCVVSVIAQRHVQPVLVLFVKRYVVRLC